MTTVAQLSVCMIVRDEERVLARCLDSIQGLYDELCIVDTGSKDRTLEIAQRYGAIMTSFTGCNDVQGRIDDFASARNEALKLASKDWILQIDADEVIAAGANLLRQVIQNDALNSIAVTIHSNGACWKSARLYRRSAASGYKGRIHEYVAVQGGSEVVAGIEIANLSDKTGKESASDRNIRLSLLTLDADPIDSRIWFYLGHEYRKIARYEQAIAAYLQADAYGTFSYGQFHIFYYIALCYLHLDQNQDAKRYALKALGANPRYAESLCLLGDLCLIQDDLKGALQWFIFAETIKTPPQDSYLDAQLWIYDGYAQEQVERIRNVLGGVV